ncbi:MAG: hypothetical protein SFU27_01740, partial [Thermonemataceae bacterium]|nr:hypothetical protein [Thermonemataceae bacterium]
KTIYAIINASVRKSLGSHHLGLDFEEQPTKFALEDFNSEKLSFLNDKPFSKEEEKIAQHNSYTINSYNKSYREKNNLKNWESIFAGLHQQNLTESFEQEKNKLFEDNSNSQEQYLENKTFQLHQRYIIAQVKSGLMIIDQHLAHERILHDKFLKNLQQKNGIISQQLLFPIQIPFNPTEITLLGELESALQNLGFVFDTNESGVTLYAVPPDLPKEQEKNILGTFLEQVSHNQENINTYTQEKIARLMAQRAAITYGTRLLPAEIQTLLAQLFASSNPNYTPNGEKIFVILDMLSLQSYFDSI